MENLTVKKLTARYTGNTIKAFPVITKGGKHISASQAGINFRASKLGDDLWVVSASNKFDKLACATDFLPTILADSFAV